MNKSLRPQVFAADASSQEGPRKWLHWRRTFESYVNRLENATDIDKLDVLINLVDTNVYSYISECTTYADAITKLNRAYVTPINEVFARHRLNNCRQDSSETLGDFLQRLKVLSNDCNFVNATAAQCKESAVRDAFIAGINSSYIRQRLLEDNELQLNAVFDKARSLYEAQKNAQSYVSVDRLQPLGTINLSAKAESTSPTIRQKYNCGYCGGAPHKREACPAVSRVCFKCNRKGHFAHVCRSENKRHGYTPSAAAVRPNPEKEQDPHLAMLSATDSTNGTEKVNIFLLVNGVLANGLIDTGAKHNHINSEFCQRLRLPKANNDDNMSFDLAVKGSAVKAKSSCVASVELRGRNYEAVRLFPLDNLRWDVILGCEFLSQHESVDIKFGGPKSSLNLAALKPIKVLKPVRLFEHLSSDCHPIATKRRNYSSADQEFIHNEIKKLLDDDIIEPSSSPWRAQVLVTKNDNQKKRMCVDYSQTINKFTHLDAYPLPTMQSIIKEVSQYKWFSKLDLRSAYHQIPLMTQERMYTGFEAGGQLYQFKRIPFGLKNAVPCFQRVINQIISDFNCEGTFAYLDDITVCGKTRDEHDNKLHTFLNAARACNITLNKNKCVYATNDLKLLGYHISNGEKRPDPERVKPIVNLPTPTTGKELQRAIGMFSYYAQWIPQFSKKIKPLILVSQFPINEEAKQMLQLLKDDLVSATLKIIDEDVPFVIETDASNNAISASLNQNNRPVAFFSRMLSKTEIRHSSIEKEAAAIVEAIRKWSQFLSGRHFTVITDQQSVSFMYNATNHGKIKNEKILRWRMELNEFDFDIVYRSGKLNSASDALSRSYIANIHDNTLRQLHESLCHPGVTRFYHFVRVKNLPYSIDDVRNVVSTCQVCSELRPNFYKPPAAQVIKATQPFERLSIDFKGPLPSTDNKRFLLTIVDEYSRFPFGFACSNINAQSLISCLNQVFAIFGMPSYLHSDRGSAFMSQELTAYLQKRGIATSRTSVYNAPGNGQCERYNGIIWQAINSALKSRNLDARHWQLVLADALHSIRSLLCTATNETPHERMFSFKRRSTFGASVPTWLSAPGPVLLKRHVRTSKYDSVVDKVDLLHATPNYAIVRMPNGRESTVSLKDIAPCVTDTCINESLAENVKQDFKTCDVTRNLGQEENEKCDANDNTSVVKDTADNVADSIDVQKETAPSTSHSSGSEPSMNNSSQGLRRSTRVRKAVDRYGAVPYV